LGKLGIDASSMLLGVEEYISVMGRVPLGDLDTDGRVTLQCVLEKNM
jgi:hypothetical protein